MFLKIKEDIANVIRPNLDYVADIINKTAIDRKPADLTFEIGYSFNEPHYRNNGISMELKKELLNQMKSRRETIFSATAMQSSQNFLKENGLKEVEKVTTVRMTKESNITKEHRRTAQHLFSKNIPHIVSGNINRWNSTEIVCFKTHRRNI